MLDNVHQKLTIKILSYLAVTRSNALNHNNHRLQTVFINTALAVQIPPNNGVHNQLEFSRGEGKERLEGVFCQGGDQSEKRESEFRVT